MSDTPNVLTPPDVLALTVLDGSSMEGHQISPQTRVRVVVRSRETNQTHPDIVSVPTGRIPAALASSIWDERRVRAREGETDLYCIEPVSSQPHSGHNPIAYAVKSLLCGKMGVADELELQNFKFEAFLVGCQAGEARYPNCVPDTEYLKMINVAIKITAGVETMPKHTGSYSKSLWAEVAGYFKMWETRDTTYVGISPEEAIKGICVDGLCISSTYDMLQFLLGCGSKKHGLAA